MLTSTLRGMFAHKLRLVLTTASIALGVAFLAGTLVLTSTMGLAFEQLFGKVSAGTDAVVRTEAPYTATEGVGTSRGPVAASVLADSGFPSRAASAPRSRDTLQVPCPAHTAGLQHSDVASYSAVSWDLLLPRCSEAAEQ